MLNIKKHHTTPRKKAIVAIIIVLIVAATATAIIFRDRLADIIFPSSEPTQSTQNSEDSSINNGPSTQEQIQSGTDIKNESVDKDSSTTDPGDDVSVTVAATKKTASSIRIQSTIGRVTNSGTCTLTLSSADTTLTYTSGVQALTSYSSCQGFDIQDLSSGSWKIVLSYKDGSMTGTADTSIEL